MQLIGRANENISLSLTDREALMIVAIIRETVFGTRVSNFETRVGYPPKEVGQVASDLIEILERLGVRD